METSVTPWDEDGLKIWKVAEFKGRPVFRISSSRWRSAIDRLWRQGILEDYIYLNVEVNFKDIDSSVNSEHYKMFFVDEKTWPSFLENIDEKTHSQLAVFNPGHQIR